MSNAYQRRRVLVLEDDAREARALTRLLEDEGFLVDTVFGGEEALGALARVHYSPYDLLVLDLKMPGLTGHHVVKFVLHHRRDLLDRVIITSSSPRREHPELGGTAAGRIPWLVKPFHPAELIRTANALTGTVDPEVVSA